MTAHDFWLLDLDGTLLTVEERYIVETLDTVGEELDREFSRREAEAIWFGRDGLRDDILKRNGIAPAAFWSAFHEIEDPEARAAATRLHPDADVVADLEGPRGVVTHCQPYLLEPILDRLDIRDWFDTVVTGSDHLGWKPDPAPVHRAMDDLGVNGGDGAMVGDSIADVEAAKNAGVIGILVDRTDSVSAPAADRVVRSLTELV